MTTFEDIFTAASALPDSERVRLVDALLSTLPPDAAPPLDDAWMAAINERSREIDEGRATLIPWEEVKANAVRQAGGHESD